MEANGILSDANLERLSWVAGIGTLFLGSAASLGAAPRAGPLRALIVGARTKWAWFAFPVPVVSQRVSEVSSLQQMIRMLPREKFIVVYGPKAVGAWSLRLLVGT